MLFSPVPHPSPLASSERLLSRKPAQSRLRAPHITTTYASCTRCTAISLCECKHTHTHGCCILCESYGTVTYGGMLVSSPHPPPYRENAAPHRSKALSQRRHFVIASADKCVHIDVVCLKLLVLVFPFSLFFPPIFLFHLFDPKRNMILVILSHIAD